MLDPRGNDNAKFIDKAIYMDCFFAEVEIRGFPVRRDGVRSAMPTAQVLKLWRTLRPGRMVVCKGVSGEIHRIFHRYSPWVDPLSLDETYLDVSDCPLHQGSAMLMTWQICANITAKRPCSHGVGQYPYHPIQQRQHQQSGAQTMEEVVWAPLLG
ncbi:hypothetical protein [Edwardsiella ictaluri]|uniref:Y-family DNA polymerase n=2 Tax=Edwardsiella ictaluri TaxID=67780 RepID=UPI0039F22FF4